MIFAWNIIPGEEFIEKVFCQLSSLTIARCQALTKDLNNLRFLFKLDALLTTFGILYDFAIDIQNNRLFSFLNLAHDILI